MNLVSATVASPDDLETELVQSLMQLPGHRADAARAGATYRVTVYQSEGVQVGDGNVQVNSFERGGRDG